MQAATTQINTEKGPIVYGNPSRARLRGAVGSISKHVNQTRAGFALAMLGWTALWGQALYATFLIPQSLAAFLFFFGVGFGAAGQRRSRGHGGKFARRRDFISANER